MSSIYLSIVVCGRNDNYGGDFNQRLQNMLLWNYHWLNHYQLESEIIFVNYNPLPDNKPIEEMVSFPASNDKVRIRILEVPFSLHQKILDAHVRKPVPLLEFIAKNVGIRRAEGKFVVVTNADVLFDPFLLRMLKDEKLSDGIFYRATRVDFELPASLAFTGDTQLFLRQIRSHVFKFFMKGGTFTDRTNLPIRFKHSYWLLFNFLRRIVYTLIYPIRKYTSLLHIPYTEEIFTFKYFCNASGDFMLMSKKDWLRTKGYPEDTWISTHTDSLHLLMAVADGMKQQVLPSFVYHQEHGRRFDFNVYDPDMDLMYNRMIIEAQEMLRTGQSNNNNTPDWGVANEILSGKIV